MKKLLLIVTAITLSNIAFSQTTYTFNGNGNWSDSANWSNGIVPPDILPADAEIIISPVDTGECILDVPQYISQSAKLTISSSKKVRMLDEIIISTSVDSFSLSTDDLDFLDSISAINPPAIILARPAKNKTGSVLGTQKLKAEVIESMLTYAQQLSAQKENGGSPVIHDEIGPHQPMHYGFAYRYGGSTDDKDISKRLKPTIGDATHLADSVFGTDCSGFLMNLIRHAGINMGLASVENFEKVLAYSLKSNSNLNYNNIRLDSLGYKPEKELKSGDIILWRAKKHDGLIYIDPDQKKYLYNSNGNPNPETIFSSKCKSAACEQLANRGNKRGIHPITMNDALYTKGYWGTEYLIFRLEDVTVNTSSVSSISGVSAVSGGSFIYTGGNEVIDRGICWGKKQNPTINDKKKSEGAGTNNFSSNLTQLIANNTYHIRAYITIRNSATDKGVTYYGNDLSFTTVSLIFTDPRDGQQYPYKQIGTQFWMTKNLNYAPGGFCYDCGTYGRLYDWTNAMAAVPSGWHIPSETEWSSLISLLGGNEVAGGPMKNIIGWNPPNVGATNSSGFSGLPGGWQTIEDAVFHNIGNSGNWWTSNGSIYGASYYDLNFDNAASKTYTINSNYRFSVRCVKD